MAVAGGAGASALIMALNSSKTVKSTKALFDTTKELNKAQSSGAIDGLNQVFQQMQQSGPVQSAFKVLFGQIQAETTGATVGLMNTLLTAFASEEGQRAIKLLIDLIILLVNSASVIVQILNAFPDYLGGGGGYDHPDVEGYTGSAMDPGTTSLTTFSSTVPWWESMGYASEEEALAALGMM